MHWASGRRAAGEFLVAGRRGSGRLLFAPKRVDAHAASGKTLLVALHVNHEREPSANARAAIAGLGEAGWS